MLHIAPSCIANVMSSTRCLLFALSSIGTLTTVYAESAIAQNPPDTQTNEPPTAFSDTAFSDTTSDPASLDQNSLAFAISELSLTQPEQYSPSLPLSAEPIQATERSKASC